MLLYFSILPLKIDVHEYIIVSNCVIFSYSTLQVLITETSKSFSHFITNICAIIGGIFTVGVHYSFYSSIGLFFSTLFPTETLFWWFQVAGILDSVLHHTIRLMRKVELGKNFWSFKLKIVNIQRENPISAVASFEWYW